LRKGKIVGGEGLVGNYDVKIRGKERGLNTSKAVFWILGKI